MCVNRRLSGYGQKDNLIELIRGHLSANEGVLAGPKNSGFEKAHFQVAVATRYGISAFGLRHDGRHAEHLLSAHRAEHLLSAHRGVLPDSIALCSRAFALMTAFAASKTPDCAPASWRAPKSFLRCGLSVAFLRR